MMVFKRGETLSDLKVSKRICLIKYKFPSFDLETLGFQLGDATGLLKSGALTQKETTFCLYSYIYTFFIFLETRCFLITCHLGSS